MVRSRHLLLLTAILLAVCGVYANHFQNAFHFDDSHTVIDNPYIRSLHNLPRFFTDATTFSVLPANRTYRPFVSASLAVDYALGHGYKPFWFHLSTFLVFLLQLTGMYVVYAAILNAARPATDASNANRYVALLAMAWYGLHPVMAETVNYIIQRGDIFCTFGVVAAMAIFVRMPAWRKTGLYLLPLAFALLSKPPAVVFPLLLFLYLAMFERQGKGGYARAALTTLPSVAVCGLLMGLQSAMTPKTFAPSILSAYSYRITQPFVLMRYFGSLFLPVHLNVDTDLQPFGSVGATALSGFLFVAVLLAVAWLTGRLLTLRPISFGLLWFLIASLPTSLYRLSEVENDHRMFLPFVGLVLAVVWAAFLVIEKAAAGKDRIMIVRAAVAIAVLLLSLYAYGAHIRNQVWRTDESLWLDDVEKCPHNSRGLMNYGLTQMGKGKYPAALDAFQRALVYAPNYWNLEINLGIVLGAMDRNAEAEQHFQRAIALAPADDQAHFFYGRWLYQSGRIFDAIRELEIAVRLNPARLPSCDLLAAAYSATGDTEKARSTAELALGIDPTDSAAKAMLSQPLTRNADTWINVSLVQFRGGHYETCIEAAKQALKLNPHSELAYNNIGAGYAGLKKWDLAIENEREALRIKPDFVLARNNLAAYTNAKAGKTLPTAIVTAEDWLNASLRDNQAGQYQRSIDDAHAALRLRPNYAEAYNNIAAGYASMGKWDEAITAAQQALRIKPDYQLARNNLAWALSHKNSGAR
ncbi:MAG: tetratricopeptide repeat protein [Terracidiphilus sp.]|nr:tetratricopeptide repeat protein [Terracidiphilus sp.]